MNEAKPLKPYPECPKCGKTMQHVGWKTGTLIPAFDCPPCDYFQNGYTKPCPTCGIQNPESGIVVLKSIPLEYDKNCPECHGGYPEQCPVCQLDGHPAVERRDTRIGALVKDIEFVMKCLDEKETGSLSEKHLRERVQEVLSEIKAHRH